MANNKHTGRLLVAAAVIGLMAIAVGSISNDVDDAQSLLETASAHGSQTPHNTQVAHDSIETADVTLYSTETCSYCKKTKSYFAKHDIDYVELMIDSDEDAAAEHRSIGGRGVPVVVVDYDEVIHGYNPRKYDQVFFADESWNH